jgi:hypothetical protein
MLYKLLLFVNKKVLFFRTFLFLIITSILYGRRNPSTSKGNLFKGESHDARTFLKFAGNCETLVYFRTPIRLIRSRRRRSSRSNARRTRSESSRHRFSSSFFNLAKSL